MSQRRAVRRVTTALALTVGVSLAAATLSPSAADARSRHAPAAPHGAHLAAVSRHTIVVALPRTARATSYRLFVSTKRSDLLARHITRARASKTSRTPRLTARHLPFTTARYYFRVRASNGAGSAYDKRIGSFSLRPAAPGALRIASSPRGTYLRWSVAGTGYQTTQVAQARNAAMTVGRQTFTIRGTTGQYTPYTTVPGALHWFRVRTLNGVTPSAWSAPVRTIVRSRLQPLRLMTYNVLTSNADGTRSEAGRSGETIAPWAQRRAGVLALIRRAAPDVLALQEGGGWVGKPAGYGGTRQVDDLLTALPGYALARTETPPTEHGYARYGNYLLYRTAAYDALGTGGHWLLGDGRAAAFQLLRNRATGARLLAVSAHLIYGAGRVGDDQRAGETRSLLAQAGALSASTGAPVVYAGDFNSVRNRNHVYDGPGLVMRAAGIADAQQVAQHLVNAGVNSANLYRRTPPAVGQSIDYVFAPAGVAVTTRAVVLDLVRGRFAGVIPSDHNPLLVNVAVPY